MENLTTNSASSKDWLNRRDLNIAAVDLGALQQRPAVFAYSKLPESVTLIVPEGYKPDLRFFGSHIEEAVEIVKDWITNK